MTCEKCGHDMNEVPKTLKLSDPFPAKGSVDAIRGFTHGHPDFASRIRGTVLMGNRNDPVLAEKLGVQPVDVPSVPYWYQVAYEPFDDVHGA